MTEDNPRENDETTEDQRIELDESRPLITLGYVKGEDEERLAVQKNSDGPLNEIEVAQMLAIAQFQNTMGFLNKLEQTRQGVEKAMKEKRATEAVDQAKQKRAKKPKKGGE